MKKIIAFLVLTSFLSSCSALHTSIAKKNLDVQTRSSNAIFLDPVAEKQRTVFIQYGNSSGNWVFDDVRSNIVSKITDKGYKIVRDPNKAQYVLQVRVLQVSNSSREAAEAALNAGYGGSGGVGGAIIGGFSGAALAGKGNGKVGTAVVGGLIGAGIEIAANALVKDTYYSTIVDVQISEKLQGGKTVKIKRGNVNLSDKGITENSNFYQVSEDDVNYSSFEEETNRKVHKTRIISTANQVNLKLENCIAAMKSGIISAITGVFL